MELMLNHTVVFSKNLSAYEKGYRFVLNQGGSRSSKTYSIIQLLIFLCLTNPNIKVSIVRKSFPSLRGSVLRDFIEIMTELNLYKISDHNKTEQVYTFPNRSSIEFFSIDDSQKVRGRKRDICYCNEGNELSYDDFLQLSLRTSKTLFIDFNPSDNDGWFYDLLKDERSHLIKSTYKDNLFLSKELKTEIENLINVDENYYKIYALGERPIPNTRIYSHFQQIEQFSADDWCYGLDFGYNHPTCLVRSALVDNDVYVEELIYRQHLTSIDLIRLMNDLNIDKRKYIYCDYSRPEIIEELKRSGYNAKDANKDVKDGIMSLKKRRVFVTKSSTNIWKEYKSYSWKTKGETILDEPVKLMDDSMDAIRYAVHTSTLPKIDRKYVGFF